MAHNHSHHHHHHGGEADMAQMGKIYKVSIAMNLAFVAVEAGVGIWSNSLGLLSDAGHNLSDVFSLLLALAAFHLAATHGTKRFTYGYRKSSVLISLLNAIILLVAVGAIVVESIHKFLAPSEVNAAAISWTAGIGILVNGFSTWLLMRGRKGDINSRGAFLHMAADTLVSVGVVISGIVISFTGWNFIDPVISLVIAAIILFSTWNLLSESLRMSIDAVPEGIDIDDVLEDMKTAEGVVDVHHLHIWPISTSETALTAHLVVEDILRAEEIVHSIKEHLSEEGIRHCTIEVETPENRCETESCC